MSTPEMKIQITGDASSALGALSQLSREVKSTTSGIESDFKALTRIVDNFKAPLLGLMGMMGGGAFLKGVVNETKDWTVEAMKLSKTLGISTESASVLNLAIGDIYGNVDEFLPVVAKLTKTLNSNEGAFQSLGVATRDSNGNLRPTVDIMMETNTKLMEMKSGTDRNVASMQIYGKGWLDVQRYLGLTTAQMEEVHAKAERLNLVVGSDGVKATQDYRAAANDLDDTLKGLKLRLGSELMPVMTQFNNLAAEEGPSAISILGDALKGIVEILDGAWSGFKMFSVGLVGLIDVACRYIITALSTAWGFLSAGIPGAKKAWQEGSQGIKEDWAATIAALDDIGIGYLTRQGQRWDGWTRQHGKVAPAGGTGTADTSSHQEKQDTFAADMLRYQRQGLAFADKSTLEAERQAELAQIENQRKADLLEIQEKLAKKAYTQSEAVRANQVVEANSQRAVNAINLKFALERAKMADEMQGQLTASEEGGLERRLEAIRKNYLKIRQENAKLAVDGVAPLTEERIQAAQAAAEAQAKKDQVQADLEKLKKEMSELATVSGGLSQQDTNEVLARYRAKDGTSAEAAGQYEREQHMGEGAGAGVQAGLRGYVAQFRNTFTTWRAFTSSILGSVESAFSTFFDSVLTKGGTFSSKLAALWKGLSSAVIKALADMVAKHLVAWGTEKAISAWKTANTARQVAMTAHETSTRASAAAVNTAINTEVLASDTATATAETAVAEQTMAAKIYAWYASLGPWAIPAAAATIAAVILAIDQIGKITAHAQGGVITGPTLALLGEGGETEVVANETSFRDWAAHLSGINFNLGSNFARQQDQVGRLNALARSYPAAGLAASNGRVPAVRDVHIHGGYFANSIEGKRGLYRTINAALQQGSRST